MHMEGYYVAYLNNKSGKWTTVAPFQEKISYKSTALLTIKKNIYKYNKAYN